MKVEFVIKTLEGTKVTILFSIPYKSMRKIMSFSGDVICLGVVSTQAGGLLAPCHFADLVFLTLPILLTRL